mgnify:CR=1 FL=1
MSQPNHELLLASRSARLSAVLLDALILVPVTFLVLFLSGIWEFDTLQESEFTTRDGITLFAAYSLLFFAFNGYLLVKQGQTIGKRIVGTKIVTVEGVLPSGASLIFLRYLIPEAISMVPVAGWLFMWVNVLFVFRQDRRCLHDHLAATYVVDAK